MGDVNKRVSYYNKLQKVLKDVNSHSTTPLTIAEADHLLERAERIMEKLETFHEQIVAVCKAEDVEGQDLVFQPMEQCYKDIRTKLMDIRVELERAAPKPGPIHTPSASTANVKLPAIELPSFNGGYDTWTSFKDLFSATIGYNKDLSDAQKLQYLKAAVKDEPAALIRSLQVTNANYKDAWDLLNERYENKREIVHSLMKRLFEPKPLVGESAQELQKLLDNTTECVRALKVNSCPTEHWDEVLVYFTVKKLDANTRREWAVRLQGSSLPTFKELTAFLENHIRGLLASGANPQRPGGKSDRKQVSTHHASSSESTCSVCSGAHFISKCEDFKTKTSFERNDLVKKHRLCFNCLKKDHRIQACKSRSTCQKCGRKHHTLLHQDRSSNQPQTQPVVGPISGPEIGNYHADLDTQVLLSTAVVIVKSRTNGEQQCRVLLDTGSEGTFITEDCAARLGLKRHPSNVVVKGISSTSAGSTKGQVNCTLVSRVSNNTLPITAHILSRVTGLLPKQPCKLVDWVHLHGLTLADPKYCEPGPVDILIGADYCGQIMLDGRRVGPRGAPIAQNSIFGWVISGRVTIAERPIIQSFNVELEVDNILKKFWEVEEPLQVKQLTQEESECEKIFCEGYYRNEEGRYVVPVPWNEKKKSLGASKASAVSRWLQVERRLKRNPEHQKQYTDYMMEYLNLGHMEEVPENEVGESIGSTYYLPHHFVVNDGSSTTKLRVVFDGSCKTSTGVSLNDAMMIGATVQPDLYSTLLRSRIHPILLKADLEKMYRKFQLTPCDMDYHRIVWRPTPDQPLKEYRLRTVTPGTACASFEATRCIEQLAKDSSLRYPLASKALQNDMYVDDLVTGSRDTSTAVGLQQQLTSATSEACLAFRKWASNDPAVLATIPEELRETTPLTFDKDQSIKALGVQWNPAQDTFSFNEFEPKHLDNLTKRNVLSDLARVFDPLGFLSAVTIRAKILMQRIWRLSVGWDDAVPKDIQQQWVEYCAELKSIKLVSIPRCIIGVDPERIEMHGFCDASEQAYGVVLYLRVVRQDKTVSVSFITSKAKVAPVKSVTLARLELLGAVMLAKQLFHVNELFNFDDCVLYAWCDSTIVLRWIADHPRRWKTFVGNRVAIIQRKTSVEAWRHVPGVQNPADLASRGISTTDLHSNEFWWKGPNWLQQHKLPLFACSPEQDDVDMEERTAALSSNTVEIDISIVERFGALSKLRRVIAYVLRFIDSARTKTRATHPLTADELINAHQACIRIVQQQHFGKEIQKLKQGKALQAASRLHSLYPYIDNKGILRVGGRIMKADIPEKRKHQIILPSDSHLTRLIVTDSHHSHLHSGFQLTWSSIMTEYWILKGRDMVRHHVRKCVICRRYRAIAAQQIMAPLPPVRVNEARPFLNTGVDYAGPFMLKNMKGRSNLRYKAYMCLFVCMATKAIHLEAVSDLSTEAFIAAFRRFVSRRGLCANMYSDCGTNFIGADKELQRLCSSQQHNEDVTNKLSTAGIRWHFNSPASPHHGGLWEAGVKSAKFHLKRVLGESLITFENFQTVLCQVEAVLNSRPICPMSSDPTDLNTLTPGHFLIGDRITSVPDDALVGVKENRLSIWQKQQQRVQHFWRRWKDEYLNTLQQRNKWKKQQPNLRVGDLVVIKEEAGSPGTWRLGRVSEVHPGEDGNVRRVTLQTSTGPLKRPVVKLILLLDQD